MNTKELIDRIFKEPGVKFELTPFSTGNEELYPFDIRKLLVWDAPPESQHELRDLHDAAASTDQESNRPLVQAKTRVEQLIEDAVQP